MWSGRTVSPISRQRQPDPPTCLRQVQERLARAPARRRQAIELAHALEPWQQAPLAAALHRPRPGLAFCPRVDTETALPPETARIRSEPLKGLSSGVHAQSTPDTDMSDSIMPLRRMACPPRNRDLCHPGSRASEIVWLDQFAWSSHRLKSNICIVHGTFAATILEGSWEGRLELVSLSCACAPAGRWGFRMEDLSRH